jgi:hypothetical protein
VVGDPPSQPSYLTLTELALNYTLFAAVGYWVAGVIGVCVGLGLLTARYAYLIWVAASHPAAAASSGQAIPQASEKPPPQAGFSTPNRSEKEF